MPQSAAQAQGVPSGVPAFTTDALGFIYIVEGGSFFTGTLGIVGNDSANRTYTLPNGQTVTGSAGISQAVRQDCF